MADFGAGDFTTQLFNGQKLVPDFAAQQAQEQQLAIQRQQAADQHSQFAAQQQQEQAAQAENQSFQTDLTHVMAEGPNAKNIAGLMLKHTAYGDKIKSAWDVQDSAAKQGDLTQLGELYSLVQAGNYGTAAKIARARYDADVSAGHADPSEEAIVKALESENSAEQKGAGALIGVHLAAVTGPEHFGSVFGALNKEPKLTEVQAGASLTQQDPTTGEIKEVYRSPYLKGADGSILERDQTGGGDPASTATVTPGSVWSRIVGPDGRGGIEGGTNPDGSFRTSSKGALGPAQVMPSTAPEAAHLAGLAYNEEKYRTDPAYNLALGKAYYSKQLSDFGDPILAAAAYNAGPGRVHEAIAKGGKTGWVAQLPAETRNYVKTVAGGASTSPNGWHVLVPGKGKDAPSGYQWSADGKALQPIPGGPAAGGGERFRILTPQENQAQGLDPTIRYQQNTKTGQLTALGGQNKQTTQAKQVPPAIEAKVKPIIDTRDSLSRLAGTFKPEFGGHYILGSALNAAQGLTGSVGPEGMRDWWADWSAMDNQVRNQLFGSALTSTEKAAYEATTISPRMDPSQIQKNVMRRKSIIDAVTARQQNYMKKNRYDPEAVDALFAPLGGGGSSGGAAPVAVRSVQEWSKLPSGTLYVDPQGRQRTKR